MSQTAEAARCPAWPLCAREASVGCAGSRRKKQTARLSGYEIGRDDAGDDSAVAADAQPPEDGEDFGAVAEIRQARVTAFVLGGVPTPVSWLWVLECAHLTCEVTQALRGGP